jgi:hypothetical protein
MACHQRRDLIVLSEVKGVDRDYDRTNVALPECRESAIDLRRGAGRDDLQRPAGGLRSCFRLVPFQAAERIVRIDQKRHPGLSRQELLQQLQPLRGK